jgi:hypothetical protein
MSEFVRVIEEEEEGIGVMKALAILSANEHRNTSRWELVEKQCFKNGRLDETHIYVMSAYDKPDEYFEPTKFLTFEIEAMAKAYIMENIEEQLRDLREEEEDDED